jgi:starch-binding outer membrane protein, SusD/RagB family
MKNWMNYGKVALVAVGMTISSQSCTNLDEEVFSQISADNVLNTEADVIAAMAGCYSQLYTLGSHNSTTSASEVSTDEAIIPQRGGDWLDGGQWLRMHRHEYTPAEASFNNAWSDMYIGIGRCNLLIASLESAATYPAYVAEMRTLRAYYYYRLLDLFGNVPLVTRVDASSLPTTASRTEIFNFVESELLASVGALSSDAAANYGRFTSWAAHALLAKLYLNAEVYTGTAQWGKCVAECDAVMGSGSPFILESNYFANFNGANNASKENIMVVPYDNVNGKGFNLSQMTLHYSSQATFNLKAQPWNGYCTSAQFYNSYEAGDVRKASLLAGQQYAADGTTLLTDPSFEAADPDGTNLNFTPELNMHFPNALRQAGARIGKYAFDAVNEHMNNDWPVLRYGDIVLAKAEALYRQNPASPEAVTLVDQIRTRAGLGSVGTLDATKMLWELGHETFFEGNRRQDLIRFGKYLDANTTWQVASTNANLNLFPIPVNQINANPKLTQNPGY